MSCIAIEGKGGLKDIHHKTPCYLLIYYINIFCRNREVKRDGSETLLKGIQPPTVLNNCQESMMSN